MTPSWVSCWMRLLIKNECTCRACLTKIYIPGIRAGRYLITESFMAKILTDGLRAEVALAAIVGRVNRD